MDDAPDGDDLTANVTYRLAVGEAWRVAESRDRSFASGRDRVRDVRLEAETMARDIGGRLGVEPISPLDGSCLGSMAALPLPERFAAMPEDQGRLLQQRLYDEHR